MWRRTIQILAQGSLIASCAAVIRAELPSFGRVGKVARRVGRGVRLGEGGQDGREGDQRQEPEIKSWWIHGGQQGQGSQTDGRGRCFKRNSGSGLY